MFYNLIRKYNLENIFNNIWVIFFFSISHTIIKKKHSMDTYGGGMKFGLYNLVYNYI